MTTAYYAGLITLVGVLAIIAVAAYISLAAGPARPKEEVIPRLYRIRLRYFIILVVLLVLILGFTLPRTPYPAVQSAGADATVAVTGQMWSWVFKPVSGEAVRMDNGTLTLPVDKLIEFQVTATDVNHGFGIYDESGHLVTQTQAMPDYVNYLRYRFKQPGTYSVLCMEYCGVGHHMMITKIKVE